MIQADVATTLDRSLPKTRFFEPSLLNTQAYYEVAQWTRIALMKLHNVEDVRQKRKGLAQIEVESRATMFARRVLIDLWKDNLPVPGVCPVEGGSVALIWSIGQRRVEAVFGSDWSGSFVFIDGDSIVGDGEICADNSEALRTALEDMMSE
jgi:hypothetical protein